MEKTTVLMIFFIYFFFRRPRCHWKNITNRSCRRNGLSIGRLTVKTPGFSLDLRFFPTAALILASFLIDINESTISFDQILNR